MKMLAASYLKCKQPDLLGGSSLVKGATFTSKLRGPMILASEESHASYGGVNLAWLSLASGCIDVLSFIELKDLFASAMTGNSALLALAMSKWGLASRLPLIKRPSGFCTWRCAGYPDLPTRTSEHAQPN